MGWDEGAVPPAPSSHQEHRPDQRGQVPQPLEVTDHLPDQYLRHGQVCVNPNWPHQDVRKWPHRASRWARDEGRVLHVERRAAGGWRSSRETAGSSDVH